jgi:transcriptional regulator with XRE-family HTH domain
VCKYTATVVYNVAQLKGRRLRMARALSGLSRQELYEKIGIATSTMDTWESGRVELTEKSADRICASLKQAGIYCSAEWLLTGEGYPPRVMDELERTITQLHDIPDDQRGSIIIGLKNKKIPAFLNENIRRELSFFLDLHNGAVFHLVKEDFLNSRYKVGDCVSGIVESDISNLINKVVIGILENGESILGKLLGFSGKYCNIFLSSHNPNEKMILINAAEVIWHRMIKRFN